MQQLEDAAGAWHHFIRILARTRCAWAIDDGDAEGLIGDGHEPLPTGLELEPPRRLFLLTEKDVGQLASARKVALHLSPELLGCRNLALVPFDSLDYAVHPPTSVSR